jgi:hypothetical protein
VAIFREAHILKEQSSNTLKKKAAVKTNIDDYAPFIGTIGGGFVTDPFRVFHQEGHKIHNLD